MHRLCFLSPLILGAALALVGCGGDRTRPRKPPLPQGDGVYLLRHNPPTCLVDRAALHTEVQTPLGWERVALEDADEEIPVVDTLTARFQAAPMGTIRVAGTLTDETRAWLGSHAARVLLVELIDPPVPEAEPPEAPPGP